MDLGLKVIKSFGFCERHESQKAVEGLKSSDHVVDRLAVNSAGLLEGFGTFNKPRNATPRTNLWPQLFQVVTSGSQESRRESLLSQSVRLTPLGQIGSRFQQRDGGRER